MNWGNGSDVISALCNVIMAGAAAFAAFNAKSWFSQRSHSKGLDFAEEIISDIDDYFRFARETAKNIGWDCSYLSELKTFLLSSELREKGYYSELAEKHAGQVEKIKKTLSLYNVIERWSINVENKGDIEIILSNLISYNTKVNWLYNKISDQEEEFRNNITEHLNIRFSGTEQKEIEDIIKISDILYKNFNSKKFSYYFNVK